MKVFSGSSNPVLARKIAKELKAKMGKVRLSRFPNFEARVWIKEEMTNTQAVVVQSLSFPPDEHLMEFCLMVDALKRLGVKKTICVIPWLGYCVQDKVFRTGEPLSSKVISNILQSLKINHLVALDLHNETVSGFFDMPFTHLSSTSIFVNYFKKRKAIDTIISPDVGALRKATEIAQALKLPLAIINKKRGLETGKVSILGINGPVKGKKGLIVDDFISTGNTLIQTAKFLKSKGIKKVYAALTHHFYIQNVQEKIEKSFLDQLFVTDTIQAPEKKYRKLKILSAAGLIAQTIKKNL